MEREPTVIDWKDLLLIVLLCLVLFGIFWLALEWAARQWSLDWLNERGRRGSVATVIAGLCGSWLGFRIADALGYQPIKRRPKP
jgi:uncharacterized membrane protein YeaQ/YmgE (transglycosylase-associated protein family)